MKKNKDKEESFKTIIENYQSFEISEDLKNKLELFSENISELKLNHENNLDGKVFSSHEGLLLQYEECFVRKINEKFYNLSADFLWIGKFF